MKDWVQTIAACYGTAAIAATLSQPGDQTGLSFAGGALIGLAAILGQSK